ncbi:MAG: hypothetical protein ABW139_04680 [Candidatus Thiodiazotropha sp. DIVDIV]
MLKGLRFLVMLFLIYSSNLLFAAHLNHNHTGQVAILPLNTVNNNFITNFTVTNTSDRYKVVSDARAAGVEKILQQLTILNRAV